jgi:hypothetical protein
MGIEAYYPVKLGALVALRPALALVLSRAELAEVFGCLGDYIFEELEGYSA